MTALLLALVLQQSPACPTPSIHPLEALQAVAQRDGARVLAIEAALTCAQSGAACTTEFEACTLAIPSEPFYDALYIADLDTPYRGEAFEKSRLWAPPPAIAATTCPSGVLQLRELLNRAREVHVLRNSLAFEYSAYLAWANEALTKCTVTPVTDDAVKARGAQTAAAKIAREKQLAEESRAMAAAAETARVAAEVEAEKEEAAAALALAAANEARSKQLSAEETAARERESAAAAARAAEAAEKARLAAEARK